MTLASSAAVRGRYWPSWIIFAAAFYCFFLAVQNSSGFFPSLAGWGLALKVPFPFNPVQVRPPLNILVSLQDLTATLFLVFFFLFRLSMLNFFLPHLVFFIVNLPQWLHNHVTESGLGCLEISTEEISPWLHIFASDGFLDMGRKQPHSLQSITGMAYPRSACCSLWNAGAGLRSVQCSALLHSSWCTRTVRGLHSQCTHTS